MKVFFDTEFTGLYKDSSLISLGMIAEDNSCFYAIFTDYDKSDISDWVQENVINNIKIPPQLKAVYKPTIVTGSKEQIKDSLCEWLESFNETIELVSDVCHYDMVLFVDIFGTAFDLPNYICPACYDINTDIYNLLADNTTEEIDMSEAFDINREELLTTLYDNDISDTILDMPECKHNSLYDAIVIKELYNEINYY